MFFFVLILSFKLSAVVDFATVRLYQKSGKLVEFKIASKKAQGIALSREEKKIWAQVKKVKSFLEEQKIVLAQGQNEIRRRTQESFLQELFATFWPSHGDDSGSINR